MGQRDARVAGAGGAAEARWRAGGASLRSSPRHPVTGKAATLSNSKLKLSQWAEAYERKRGKVYCPQRVRNNARASTSRMSPPATWKSEKICWHGGLASRSAAPSAARRSPNDGTLPVSVTTLPTVSTLMCSAAS